MPDTFEYEITENDLENYPLLKEAQFSAGDKINVPRGASKSILRDEEFVKSLRGGENGTENQSQDQEFESDENKDNQNTSVSEEEEGELPKVDGAQVIEVLNDGRHVLNPDGSVKMYHCKCADGTTRHVEADLIPAKFVPALSTSDEVSEEEEE